MPPSILPIPTAQVCDPMCSATAAVGCYLGAPQVYNIVTAASDAASGAPLVPGLGTRRCAGTFFSQEAIFRALQLNCLWELYIFSRKVCLMNEAAGVRVLGGVDAVPNGMGICWPLLLALPRWPCLLYLTRYSGSCITRCEIQTFKPWLCPL